MKKIMVCAILMIIGSLVIAGPVEARSKRVKTRGQHKKAPDHLVTLPAYQNKPASWWYRYHYKNWKAAHEDLTLLIDANRPTRQRNFRTSLESLYGMKLFLPAEQQEALQSQIDSMEGIEGRCLKGILKREEQERYRRHLEKIYRAVHREFSYTEIDLTTLSKPESYQPATLSEPLDGG